MFGKNRKKDGRDYISTGDTSLMKIRQGYNETEKKFYLQIQEIENQKSLRIYLDGDYFLTLANAMIKTHELTTAPTPTPTPKHLPSDKTV